VSSLNVTSVVVVAWSTTWLWFQGPLLFPLPSVSSHSAFLSVRSKHPSRTHCKTRKILNVIVDIAKTKIKVVKHLLKKESTYRRIIAYNHSFHKSSQTRVLHTQIINREESNTGTEPMVRLKIWEHWNLVTMGFCADSW